MSQFSTPQEIQKFMEAAGFNEIRVDDVNPQLVVAVGRKPHSDAVMTAPPHSVSSPPRTLLLRPVVQPNAAFGGEGLGAPPGGATGSEIHDYARFLEAEVARKNAALADLVARLKKRERELIAARQPRLPWKRRKGRR